MKDRSLMARLVSIFSLMMSVTGVWGSDKNEDLLETLESLADFKDKHKEGFDSINTGKGYLTDLSEIFNSLIKVAESWRKFRDADGRDTSKMWLRNLSALVAFQADTNEARELKESIMTHFRKMMQSLTNFQRETDFSLALSRLKSAVNNYQNIVNYIDSLNVLQQAKTLIKDTSTANLRDMVGCEDDATVQAHLDITDELSRMTCALAHLRKQVRQLKIPRIENAIKQLPSIVSIIKMIARNCPVINKILSEINREGGINTVVDKLQKMVDFIKTSIMGNEEAPLSEVTAEGSLMIDGTNENTIAKSCRDSDALD